MARWDANPLCRICGERIPLHYGIRPGRHRKVCSDPCRKSWERLRMAAKTYGLTIEEVLHLRSLPCAICGDPHKSGLGGHVIDHDHATGIVRGALCNHCNQCLGRAKDRVDVLLAAAEYLLQHSTKPIVIDRAAVPTVRSFLTFQGEFIP